MAKINIILVDDHQIVRDGIKSLINSMEDMEVIGESSNGKRFIELLHILQPEVAIIDISLPDVSGIELARLTSGKYPNVKVLMLSMYTDEQFIFNSLKAGAIGYLPKNTSREELREAILNVNQGIEYFPEAVSKIILNSYIKKARDDSNPAGKGISILSGREQEVLCLFLEGFGNREIAEKLFISTRTVESHKNHIMNKLELKSNIDLVKFAIQNKIIEF